MSYASENGGGQRGLYAPAIPPESHDPFDVKALLDEVQHNAAPAESTSERPAFPVNSLPPAVQEIIRAAGESLNFHPAFIGSALLTATGMAIGNARKLEGPQGAVAPIFYTCLVGRPGTGKSKPVQFALQPLQDADNEAYEQYRRAKIEAETNGEAPPQFAPSIVSDTTPEALAACHQQQPRGLGVYRDELAGWLNDFNRYNKSGEAERWNTLWSGYPLQIDRKTSEPVRIQSPCISVIGTLQPAMLEELAGGKRAVNGFLDRFLFAHPDIQAQPWSNNGYPHAAARSWHHILQAIRNLPHTDELIPLDPEAATILHHWQAQNVAERNAADDATASALAKLDIYLLRFALVVQALLWASGESELGRISPQAAAAAVRLTEYYKGEALAIRQIIADPLARLPETQRCWYNALPEEFKTAEAKAIGQEYGVPPRTVRQWLKTLTERKVLDKLKYAQYGKRV